MNTMKREMSVSMINEFVEKGNSAIEIGAEEGCLNWYYLALRKAKELKNKVKEIEVSHLIYSMI